ncbi:MAG TPA: hypothetical protein VE111_21215 [Bradyrhizobium sp.]|nr:hypothetical protein [Bradyrhizobium sp.]
MGKGPTEFDDGYHKKWVSVRNMERVPDAVQRFFGGAPQSRDPGMLRQAHGPQMQRITPQRSGALRSIRGTPTYARFFARIKSANRWNK